MFSKPRSFLGIALFAFAAIAAPRAVQGQASGYNTIITSPMDQDVVTPDPTSGYFTVGGQVSWSFLHAAPAKVEITLKDATGAVQTKDSLNTVLQNGPKARTYLFSNAYIKSTALGTHTLEAQARDSNGNALGQPDIITISIANM